MSLDSIPLHDDAWHVIHDGAGVTGCNIPIEEHVRFRGVFMTAYGDDDDKQVQVVSDHDELGVGMCSACMKWLWKPNVRMSFKEV